MYIGFQSVPTTAVAQAVTSFSVPAKTTHVEVQAVTQAVSYTMDGSNPTATAGMQLLTTEGPRMFLVEDFNRIRFVQGAGGAGLLNVHYYTARNV